jgi:hypothetical protein
VNPSLRGELDLTVRILLWGSALLVGVVAVQPAVLDLPGAPLLALAAATTYLALSHLAIQLTVGAMGAVPQDQNPQRAFWWARLGTGPGGAMPLILFTHGIAVLLCGVGPLPGDASGAMTFVTTRLGTFLLGLGVCVLALLSPPGDRRQDGYTDWERTS